MLGRLQILVAATVFNSDWPNKKLIPRNLQSVVHHAIQAFLIRFFSKLFFNERLPGRSKRCGQLKKVWEGVIRTKNG
jgi:hypothetical protein